jgi:hypothetical protein
MEETGWKASAGTPEGVVVTEDMKRWVAGALSCVHIAKAIEAVRVEYDFNYADECLVRLWLAVRDAPTPPHPIKDTTK